MTGTDTGCGGAPPACDAAANGGLGACVGCAGTADCVDGDECTAVTLFDHLPRRLAEGQEDAVEAHPRHASPLLEGGVDELFRVAR